MTDGESGAFFAADGDFVLLDQLADVFEADRRFVQFDLVMFGQRIDQICGGDGLRRRRFSSRGFRPGSRTSSAMM